MSAHRHAPEVSHPDRDVCRCGHQRCGDERYGGPWTAPPPEPVRPCGRPPFLAGARRVNVTIDGETDRIVTERAARDGVSWAEALRRIVRGGPTLPELPRRTPHISPDILALAEEDDP